MNRSEILIIRYRSTTVISISPDQAEARIVSTDTNKDTVIDAQPNRTPRLASLQIKKLAGWASQLPDKLFGR